MTTLTKDRAVAKAKPSKPKPRYVPAKIGEEAVRLGKIAASFKT